jgi:hypothetical protein
MGARVRVAKGNIPDLEVVGHGSILVDTDTEAEHLIEYVAKGTLEGVGPASLSWLRQALLRWRDRPMHDSGGAAETASLPLFGG